MKKFRRRVNNEDGAVSLEFLGILPLFFMLFLILWQVVASGYGIYTMKTAVNEGAKTYAVTSDVDKAEDAVKEIIGSTNVLTYKQMYVVPLGHGRFELHVEVDHSLIFVPNQWRPQTAITLNDSIVSRMLVP